VTANPDSRARKLVFIHQRAENQPERPPSVPIAPAVYCGDNVRRIQIENAVVHLGLNQPSQTWPVDIRRVAIGHGWRSLVDFSARW